MSADHQTLIAEALAAHERRPDWHCACGEDFFGGTFAYTVQTHREHQAAALLDSPEFAAVLADVRAGAWDEGHNAAYLFERGEVHPEPRNPYRSDERASHE